MAEGSDRRAGGEGPSDPRAGVLGALHDVSNALTVLLGWVAEARAQDASPDAIQRALVVIESRARIARDLARRAIGARPAADSEESDGAAPLDAVLRDVTDALAVEAQRTGVRIVQASRAQSTVLSSRDVSQIVTNVLLNALAFAPPGSEIRVEVSESRSTVRIDVVDEGPGVSESRRATIFEGDSTREGGAGIGLPHARSIARAAGGDLEILGAPGGARFRLTWPRGDVLTRSTSQGRAASPLQGTRVLIVEDDDHVTLLLETALTARGALVTVVKSASELEAAVLAGEHDAALIDLSPIAADVDGAVASITKRSPGAALVFISGSAIALPAVLQASAVRWVRKPFEVSEVVSALVAARAGSPGSTETG